MRGLRQASEFLRLRRGVQERKCLACGQWKVEAASYTMQSNHGKMKHVARCKPCNAAHRAAKAISSARQPAADLPPLPPDPPPLEWPTVLRGVL